MCIAFAFCSAMSNGKLHQAVSSVLSLPVYIMSPHHGVKSVPLLLGTGNTLLSDTDLCSVLLLEQPNPSTWKQPQSFWLQNCLSLLMLLSVFQALEIQSVMGLRLLHNCGDQTLGVWGSECYNGRICCQFRQIWSPVYLWVAEVMLNPLIATSLSILQEHGQQAPSVIPCNI